MEQSVKCSVLSLNKDKLLFIEQIIAEFFILILGNAAICQLSTDVRFASPKRIASTITARMFTTKRPK